MANYYPVNMQQRNEWNPMRYNPMVYGSQQINTINYQYQYVCPYPVYYYIPQYIYYIPQYVVYYTPEYTLNTTEILNNDEPASDGYTPCVECKDIEIQTDVVATTDSIFVQTNIEQNDVAIQCHVATKQKSVETISTTKVNIEIQTNILKLNTVCIQTDPCILTERDVSQSEELSPEEEAKKFIVIMEPINDLNLKSCIRPRSAYEEEEVQVATSNRSRPVKKKAIQFNDWLNKVKII